MCKSSLFNFILSDFHYNGAIAEYFELLNLAEGEVEIAYFGLAPQFIGKGFGGYMLSLAVKLTW